MARRSDHQATIDRLTQRIREDNITGSRQVDGGEFLRWSADTILNSRGDAVTMEDIESSITDGAHDQGMDMMYVDHDDETVYLIQSKFATASDTIKQPEIDTFTKLPERLMDAPSLRDIPNHRVKEIALEFRNCIDERGYELRLLFVTTKRATEPIRRSVQQWNQSRVDLGFRKDVNHALQVVDADELLRMCEPVESFTSIELEVANVFESEGKGTVSGLLSCLIPATTLIDAFNEHWFAIFELNPRGPLGNVKVNKQIRDTLRDEYDRANFHLLNNGLTAVCNAFKVNRDAMTVSVENLQIVNGCQTTWTLRDHYVGWGKEGLTGVFVVLKLIEARRSKDLAQKISQTSNSQSQMRDWDFLFNRDDQTRLQAQFAKLGVFYELKRGEQKFIEGQEGGKTNIQTAAQAAWAMLGFPGEAKDRLREVPRSALRDEKPYKTVFFDGIHAAHLQLPIELMKQVNLKWKDDPRRHEQEVGQVNRKLHAVWLIGQVLMRAADIDDYAEWDPSLIIRISRRIDEWFDDVYPLVSRSIDDTVDALTRNRGDGTINVSIRQAFRSNQHYEKYLRDLDYYVGREPEVLQKLRIRLDLAN